MDWKTLATRVDRITVNAFGRTGTFAAAGEDPVDVSMVFDGDYRVTEIVGGVPQESATPMVGLHVPDLPRYPAQGDQVTLDGQIYDVVQVIPPFDTGEGGVECELARVEP